MNQLNFIYLIFLQQTNKKKTGSQSLAKLHLGKPAFINYDNLMSYVLCQDNSRYAECVQVKSSSELNLKSLQKLLRLTIFL